MRYLSVLFLFLFVLSHLRALDQSEVSLTDEIILSMEELPVHEILSLMENYICRLEGVSIDEMLSRRYSETKVGVLFQYYPFENDDPSLDNLSNKYMAIVLTELLKKSGYETEDLQFFVDYLDSPGRHSLVIYEIEESKKKMHFDYSGRLGVIREEFRWESGGEYSLQTGVLRGNVMILHYLIKEAMRNRFSADLRRAFQ